MPETISYLPSPLLYRPIGKSPVFTMTAAARFIVRPNEDVSAVHNRLKNLAQRLLIHRRIAADAKPNDPAYFGIEDIATAEVLLALFDAGVRSASVAQAASRACYFWDQKINPRPAYIPKGVPPIAAAMIGAGQGQSWGLRLAGFHDAKIGQRVILAALHDTDVPVPDLGGTLPPGFTPEVDTVMQISLLMLRFGRFLKEPPVTTH